MSFNLCLIVSSVKAVRLKYECGDWNDGEEWKMEKAKRNGPKKASIQIHGGHFQGLILPSQFS